MNRDFIRKVLTECNVSFDEHKVNQIIGTAIIESNVTNVKQQGGGPALGYFQMEPRTREDILTNYIGYHPLMMKQLSKAVGSLSCSDKEFMLNPALQVVFCWLHYRRYKAWGENVWMYAVNWKRKYNTMKGKGKSSEYVKRYLKYMEDK